MEKSGTDRVYFIDWLRILAVLLLFLVHTLCVFEDVGWYVKLGASKTVGAALELINPWHMPLLFFIAGCSTFFALQKRTGRQYGSDRLKRLLVPLVFGYFVLVPPQTWFGGRLHAGYAGSYWNYLSSGSFLRWNIQNDGLGFDGFGVGHLWFILFLLVMSLIALPLLVWASRGSGAEWTRRFGNRLARPVWWILPVVVLFIGKSVPGIPGGSFVYYLFAFVLGFVAMCSPGFTELAERYRVPATVGGLALTIAGVLTYGIHDSLPNPSWSRTGLELMGCASVWLMLVGVFGLGKRYLDRTSRAQRYLGEASYPVYILHQTVIVVIGFYLVPWTAPRPVLWVVLLVGAVVGTFTLYEIVHRVGVLRFLFGMRSLKRAPGAMPAPEPSTPLMARTQAVWHVAPAPAAEISAPSANALSAGDPNNGA
jgi:peptidoglycan/LPS O-acetylase OafA/YrhL